MPVSPVQLIDRARGGVRQALRQWKPQDLKHVHECRALLERSVADLKAAIDLLRNEPPLVTDNYQIAIAGLRRDISTMIRLVDACIAFHRGLSPQGAGATPAYDASGQTIRASDGVPGGGVVG